MAGREYPDSFAHSNEFYPTLLAAFGADAARQVPERAALMEKAQGSRRTADAARFEL